MSFNGEWYSVKLKDIGNIITGKTPSTKKGQNFGDKYLFITPRDMKGQKYIKKTERSLSDRGLETIKNQALQGNSICVSCIGSDMGEVTMVSDSKYVTNQQINTITDIKKEYDPDFIYYKLKPLKPFFHKIAGGSTMPIINKSRFSDIEIKVPHIKEQKAIADILSSLDKKIELNNQMNKTLEAIAQAIYKNWFVDFEPWQDGEFVDSELGRIPKGWEVIKLGNLIEFVKGKSPKKKTKKKTSGFKKYLSISVLEGNELIYAQDEKGINVIEKDILMVMDGSRSGKVFSGLKGIVASTLAKINVINEVISRDFIYCLLRHYEDEFMNHTTGSAVPHADKTYIYNKKIIFPSKSCIKEFSTVCSKLRERMYVNNSESQTLSQIRDALLPKLMSGEIRVEEFEREAG